ncbi:hypothetical protein M513_08736 [Trichuris suis]|uniref:Uncharacterized protein n=1 Tax=Trichuris suis TaxID=68888 RepID=A0A085LZF8_9BILA|nr:hypothetical protein M513_08736 [Trichuris suis]
MGDAEKQSISNPADPEKKGRRRKKKRAVIIEHVVDEGFDPRPVVLSAERLLTHPDIAKAARRVGKLPHCLKERAKRMGRRYISMYINDDENTTNEITMIKEEMQAKEPVEVKDSMEVKESMQMQRRGQVYHVVVNELKKPAPNDQRDSSLNNAPIMNNEELSEFLILND